MSIAECKVLTFPKLVDDRGSLSFIENNKHIPFEIKRIFYIYDLSLNADRGAHAHKKCEQILICLSGGFNVTLDDGFNTRCVTLDNPWEGLYIPSMIWATETNFKPHSLFLILASDFYDETDYFREYETFITAVRARACKPSNIFL